MMCPVDVTHGKICNKINGMIDILRRLTREKDNRVTAMKLNLVIDDLEKLGTNYKMSTIDSLSAYYFRPNDRETAVKYYRTVTGDALGAHLNQFLTRIQGIVASLPKMPDSPSIARQLENLATISIDTLLDQQDYKQCDCEERMSVAPETSEMYCDACGRTKIIIGTVFKDDQFFTQDSQQKTKNGYDHIRHFKFWVERIQAKESKTFESFELEKLEKCLRRDDIRPREINVALVRKYLKETQMTKYNDHSSLLVKLLGGPPPPLLTFEENRSISIKFNKVMVLYKANSAVDGNSLFYCYFLYKLIETEFANNPDKLRLINYIHVQSGGTVKKNDIHYKAIAALCDKSDGVVYKPTDCHAALNGL